MDYRIRSFRHGELILEHEPNYKVLWDELKDMIDNITDKDIETAHKSFSGPPKSLSKAINKVFRDKMPPSWTRECKIFKDPSYKKAAWKLDFAKEHISLEVAFNHGEAIAWNLVKPVIASELNHVEKEIQTDIGIVICATKNLKTLGGFDGSVGEFEKFETYLNPLRNMLTIPIVVIGLEAPKTFKIVHRKVGSNNHGDIEYI